MLGSLLFTSRAVPRPLAVLGMAGGGYLSGVIFDWKVDQEAPKPTQGSSGSSSGSGSNSGSGSDDHGGKHDDDDHGGDDD